MTEEERESVIEKSNDEDIDIAIHKLNLAIKKIIFVANAFQALPNTQQHFSDHANEIYAGTSAILNIAIEQLNDIKQSITNLYEEEDKSVTKHDEQWRSQLDKMEVLERKARCYEVLAKALRGDFIDVPKQASGRRVRVTKVSGQSNRFKLHTIFEGREESFPQIGKHYRVIIGDGQVLRTSLVTEVAHGCIHTLNSTYGIEVLEEDKND